MDFTALCGEEARVRFEIEERLAQLRRLEATKLRMFGVTLDGICVLPDGEKLYPLRAGFFHEPVGDEIQLGVHLIGSPVKADGMRNLRDSDQARRVVLKNVKCLAPLPL